MSIKNVMLVGAGGNLGPEVLSALQSHSFNVTVLSRASSKSTFPSSVKVITIPDNYPTPELVSAFRGQDAVVTTVAAPTTSQQTEFIDAAIQAGVKRFMPAEFGSNNQDPTLPDSIPMAKDKADVLSYLKSKASAGDISYTAIASSGFLDWGLGIGFFEFDVRGRKATIYDSGETAFPATNLATVGLAVARALQKAPETENKYLYISDFRISPNQLLAEFEKQSGKWEVKHGDLEAMKKESWQRFEKGDFFGVYGLLLANILEGPEWETLPDYANELLELPKADLQETVKRVLEAAK